MFRPMRHCIFLWMMVLSSSSIHVSIGLAQDKPQESWMELEDRTIIHKNMLSRIGLNIGCSLSHSLLIAGNSVPRHEL